MLSRKKAQQRIIGFTKKYEGKDIEVRKLNNRDRYDLALTVAYLNIDALLGYDSDVAHTLDRAIEYADKEKQKDNLDSFIAEQDEIIRII